MIKEILVNKSVKNNPLTFNILRRLHNIPIKYIDNLHKMVGLYSDKKKLLITENKGKFLKRCPGTKNYICCGYYFLNTITNCPLDCNYCILQSYFKDNPLIQVFVNFSSLFEELKEKLSSNLFYRIGTGELTDSLALENITHFTSLLIPFFSQTNNVILELKTKTNNIKPLLKFNEPKNIVVSWSLNSHRIINECEFGTASLYDRIEAAKVCVKKGYIVGFHFDPLIRYFGWEEEYKQVVELIFRNIESNKIIWISMGTFRFMPQLKSIIEKRFPKTNIIYEEFITGLDNKLRYFRPLRVEIYKKMLSWIREFSQDVFVYLCMESKEVWEEVFGEAPKNLSSIMDRRGKEFLAKK